MNESIVKDLHSKLFDCFNAKQVLHQNVHQNFDDFGPFPWGFEERQLAYLLLVHCCSKALIDIVILIKPTSLLVLQ